MQRTGERGMGGLMPIPPSNPEHVGRLATNIPEAKSKEKHGVWDPMPDLTIISPYGHFRVDSNTFTMGNPMPESTLTLCQSWLYPSVRDFGFGLRLTDLRGCKRRGRFLPLGCVFGSEAKQEKLKQNCGAWKQKRSMFACLASRNSKISKNRNANRSKMKQNKKNVNKNDAEKNLFVGDMKNAKQS
jgi:hypothetical protein